MLNYSSAYYCIDYYLFTRFIKITSNVVELGPATAAAALSIDCARLIKATAY